MSILLALKGCPRCRGDVVWDSDYYGVYIECLQCGYVVDLDREEQPQAGPIRDKSVKGGRYVESL